ncbi:MAG: RNA-binding S4 domain-containing protein [Clostridia bacterium]|nr:RNA-binding S4 domain-containing protein [Clostridia bacterium]
MQTEEIKISTEYIKLDQLLKFSGVAENGADAKDMILAEIVDVNGEVCTMRGKKIRPNDEVIIHFEDEILKIEVK